MKQGGMKKGANAGGAKSGGQKQTKFADPFDGKDDNEEDRDVLNSSDIEWKGTALDRSDRGYADLSEIKKHKEKIKKPWRLTDIMLNNNMLETLDGLSEIPTLVRIEVKDNRLLDARLRLDNLKELDLSRNLLSDVPPLKDLPKIQILILRGNKIRNIKNKLSIACYTLTRVDLSMNELALEDTNSVRNIVDEFKSLIKVEDIDITDNPVMKQFHGIWRYIAKEVGRQLSRLNKEDINPDEVERIKEQALKPLEDISFANVNEDDGRKTRATARKSGGQDKTDRLSFMLENLELASTTPTRCVEYITKIATAANELITMSEVEWEKIFFSENQKKRIEITEKIDSFLENCVILIENQHSIQNTLLSTLASLTVITTSNFGKRCLLLLGDFLNPGISRQLQAIIKKKIRNIVIPNIQQKKIQDLPLPVLEGLSQIVQDDDLGILFFDTCSYFIGWIKEIHKDCINEGNFQDLPTQKLYKAVLELLSKISLNEEVAKEITSLGVTKYISGIFRSFIRKEPNNNEIYQLLYVLKLIQNTSILGADIAYEYIEAREAKISVIEDIKTSTMIWMDAYKGKNYDLKDTQDPPETQKLKYMLFSSLISTFGALAHFLPNDKLMAVLSEFGYVLLSYAAHQKAEPLLLTSICEFAYNVVTSEAGKHSRTCIENVFNSLGRLLPLMLYMGDTYAPHISTEKYRFLCQSAELYHKGTMIKSEAVRLEANTNPIVHKLFTAIIRLITFICKHANINCNIQEKCQEYSSILNEGGRETILFSCLQIPSDEVKLAIAKCLDEVSVKEIEVDEMAYFSRLISTYKNLGAGRTEEVLSLIFIIMTKVLRDNGASSREFITKYSQNAVGDALDILTRNMERNLKGEPEEQEEKVALSLACIYFLRAASENPTIRVFMVDQNALNGMKRSLYFEELLMRNYPIPIEIESTYIGRNIEYLFRCMAGQESLSPDSIVSFRVISRVADLLMGVKDSPYDTLSGEEAIEALRNRVSKDFKQKLKLEITNWDDYADKAREAFKKLISNENEKDNLSQCHKLISSFDGLNRLLLFVIKKELTAAKTKDEKRYQVTLNDDFNKKIATLQAKIGRKSHQNIEDPDKKKLKGQFKFFLQAELQRHALSSGQVDKKEIARLILEPPSKASEEAAQEAANEAKKQKHVEVSLLAEVIPGFTIDDDKRVRIFIVSAVLRVIYAAVNFFVDVDTKKRALQQIKNIQILLPLTELCASIGWTNSNIATKYFTIMFALLEELQQDPNESLTIEIFDIISKVIADVLKLLRRKIQNVEKVPLSLEDEKLLLNLTYCTSLMCSRLSSMQLLKDAKMDQLITAYKEQNKDRDNGHGISSLKPEGIIKQTAMRFLLVRLVPLHIIYTLLDIVFINMSKYANPGQGSKISEYERAEKTNIGIAQLLGEYLANCIDFKYSILKYFVDAEIYDNRIVRQTFLQEVLIQEQLCKLRSNIQEYCKQSNFISPTGEVFRMVFYGEMTEVGGKKWKKKLFGFTNLAFYVFSPSNNRPCSLCPPDSLCPEGPSLDYKIPFSDLTFCVNFLKTARIGIAFVQEKKGFTKLLSKETKQEVKLIISLVGTPDKEGAVYQLVTNGIHVIQDNLLLSVLETQLNTKIDDNYFIAVVRMISSKEANVTRQSFFDEKRIIVFSQEELYIFSEAVEYWVVELPETEVLEDDKELLDAEAKLKLAEVDLRKKATMYLAKQVKKMSLYSIASFLTEDNGIPIGEIKAGKDEMKMIFGEECELDRFRVELFRRIAKTKPQMKVEVYSALRPR